MAEMSAGKTMFWVAIILGVIIAGGIIFIQKFHDSGVLVTDISRDALIVGTELSMEAAEIFVVNFVDGEHEFIIEEILKTKIRLREGLVFYDLFDGKTLEFDFDGDEGVDVVVSLDEIDEEVISLKVESPIVENCTESWECSDWGECIEGLKGRVCVDQSICGTELSKPAFSESC